MKKCWRKHHFKAQLLCSVKKWDFFHVSWYVCDSLLLYFCEQFVIYALILILNIVHWFIIRWIGHSWVLLRRWMCFWIGRSASEWSGMSEIILSAFGISRYENKNVETLHKGTLLYCLSILFGCLWCLQSCRHQLELLVDICVD